MSLNFLTSILAVCLDTLQFICETDFLVCDVLEMEKMEFIVVRMFAHAWEGVKLLQL